MKHSFIKQTIFTLVATFIALSFIFPNAASAQSSVTACDADINLSGLVDIDDYSILVTNIFKSPVLVERANIDKQGLVDLSDYSALVSFFLKPCTLSSSSTSTSSSSSASTTSSTPANGRYEWTQDGYNAQRVGYTPENPGSSSGWTFAWNFNGSDSNGGAGGHTYNAGREARTVTGGAYVYVPANNKGLYALAKTNGSVGWNVTGATFNGTPAYDPATGMVFAGATNGTLYKVNAATGQVAGTYSAGNAISRPVMVAGGAVYALTDNGQLHKVTISNMARAWMYSAGANAGTSMAYSASRDIVIFTSADLYVHAVTNSNGAQKWKVKPTPNTAGFPNEFNAFWPVVAEKNGVVFLRMRLAHDPGLWGGPGTNGKGGSYGMTNEETRNWLISKANLQNLFALNLDDGSKKFIPAVGYGGVEATVNGSFYLDTGPVPVIKNIDSNTEVAYQIFRSGQTNNDGRWDSVMGEMVLNNNTISGLQAGDLRFVKWGDKGFIITDEQTPVTMAGNTLFHAHWAASESNTILDRSTSKGLTYSNPITVQSHPPVVRRATNCGNFNPTTHYATCYMNLYGDTRGMGQGWWEYWNTMDPPTPQAGAYSEGVLPRYTYVSDGLIIVEGNGGGLMAFRHN